MTVDQGSKPPIIPDLLVLRRMELNLSMEEVARRAGVSIGVLRAFERGLSAGSNLGALQRIAAAYGSTAGELLTLSERGEGPTLVEAQGDGHERLLAFLHSWAGRAKNTVIMDYLEMDLPQLRAAAAVAKRALEGTGLTLWDGLSSYAVVPNADGPGFRARRLLEEKHAGRAGIGVEAAKVVFAVWKGKGTYRPASRLQSGARLLRAHLLVRDSTTSMLQLSPELAYTLGGLQRILNSRGRLPLSPNMGNACAPKRYSLK